MLSASPRDASLHDWRVRLARHRERLDEHRRELARLRTEGSFSNAEEARLLRALLVLTEQFAALWREYEELGPSREPAALGRFLATPHVERVLRRRRAASDRPQDTPSLVE